MFEPRPCEKEDCLFPTCDGTCGWCHGRGYINISGGMLHYEGITMEQLVKDSKKPCPICTKT